jgi:hypothetical protein
MEREIKNVNPLFKQGFGITDMEFCKDFNLDPALAGTMGLNIAMLDKVMAENISGFMKQGMSREKARAEAGKRRAKAKRQIMELQD